MTNEKGPPGNLQSARSEPFDLRYRTVLSRTLSSLQTLFMVVNLVLGIGYFQNTTYAINVAGVGGATLAVCLVGTVVCSVTVCVQEMLTQFPISNAKVEFVHSFVDEDLAHIVGMSYWLAYTAFFSAFITSAVNVIANMAEIPLAARTGTTIGIFCLLVAANFARVRIFGYIELLLGVAKLGLVSAVFGLMVYTAQSPRAFKIPVGNFGSDGISTRTDAQAIFVAMSLFIYPFIGIEAVATMSFETLKPSEGLRKTRYIAYVITAIYVALTIVTGVRFPRTTPNPAIYDYQGLGGVAPLSFWPGNQTYSVPATTVLLSQVGLESRVLNGFYVFSAISAGNTALYVASRTLFGIVRRVTWHKKVSVQAFVGGLGQVSSRTRVPGRAIIISCVCFIWVAILVAQSTGGQLFYLAQTLDSMAISACVVVWASQCVAYLRYYNWQKRFNNNNNLARPSAPRQNGLWTSSWQPLPAWFGLIGCLLLVFVFDGATLWSTKENFAARFCGAYLSPIIMATVWISWKVSRILTGPKESFHWIVQMHDDASFRKAVLRLKSEIYPTDYPIREDAVPHKLRTNRGKLEHTDDEDPNIDVVNPSSRTCTDSSDDTVYREPEISRIADNETVEREPALAGPLYCSPRSTMTELAAHLGRTQTGPNISGAWPHCNNQFEIPNRMV